MGATLVITHGRPWTLVSGGLGFGELLLLGCAVAVGLAAVARSLGPQTADFLVTVIAIGLLYVLALSFLTLIWCHRFVGPVIAFRRMLAALLAGDASARVQLRRGSAFVELAEDLNALAERIATDESQRT